MSLDLKKYKKQKYLKAEDLQGEVPAEIDWIDQDVLIGLPKEPKDLMYFVGMDEPLVLKHFHVNYLAQALGSRQ